MTAPTVDSGSRVTALLRSVFTGKRLLFTAVTVALITALVQPIFFTPYRELVWQLFAVALFVQVAFSAGEYWPLPGVPRWVSQVLAVVLAGPLATLLLAARWRAARPAPPRAPG